MLPWKSGSQNFEVTNKRDRHNSECHSETVLILIDGYSTEVARSSDGLFHCPVNLSCRTDLQPLSLKILVDMLKIEVIMPKIATDFFSKVHIT
jgi:hypothetical protein